MLYRNCIRERLQSQRKFLEIVATEIAVMAASGEDQVFIGNCDLSAAAS